MMPNPAMHEAGRKPASTFREAVSGALARLYSMSKETPCARGSALE